MRCRAVAQGKCGWGFDSPARNKANNIIRYMKTIAFKTLVLLCTAVLLSACSDDDDPLAPRHDGPKPTELHICCWGDSKTQGGQEGPGISYPDFLQALIHEHQLNATVYNFGANGETSIEIMQRQGARELIVQPFDIPESSQQEVRIAINSRLRDPDAGCNPCIINGVEGNIRHDWDDPSERTFYFQRLADGPAVNVLQPTTVVTDAMRNHRNDVMVIDIGYNGEYVSRKDLISQCQQMIDYSDCNDFIVIGRASHYYSTSDKLEQAFTEAFGDHYIALSPYYVQHGLQDAGLQPSPDDLSDISEQRPPRSLFLDDHHENAYGYTLKARLVFDRLVALGILPPL